MSEARIVPVTFIANEAVAYDMALAQAPYQEAAIVARNNGDGYQERVARNMAEAVSIVAGRRAIAALNQKMFSETVHAALRSDDLAFEERIDADLAEVARVNAGLAAISRLEQQVESGEPSRQQLMDV
jgi:hypothetical protein